MNSPWKDEGANVDANNRLASQLTLSCSLASTANYLASKQDWFANGELVSTYKFNFYQTKADISAQATPHGCSRPNKQLAFSLSTELQS